MWPDYSWSNEINLIKYVFSRIHGRWVRGEKLKGEKLCSLQVTHNKCLTANKREQNSWAKITTEHNLLGFFIIVFSPAKYSKCLLDCSRFFHAKVLLNSTTGKKKRLRLGRHWQTQLHTDGQFWVFNLFKIFMHGLVLSLI